MSKLPFNRAIFWKVFITVMVLVLVTYIILFYCTSYQLTNADKYGSLISALILSYLVHLWLLPSEYVPEEDYDEESEEEDDDAAEGPESEESPGDELEGGGPAREKQDNQPS